MKHYMISIFIHLLIFLGFYSYFINAPKPNLKIGKIQVSVNRLSSSVSSSKNSNSTKDIEKKSVVKEKEIETNKKSKIKKQNKVKHKIKVEKVKKIENKIKNKETEVSENTSLVKNSGLQKGDFNKLTQSSDGSYIGDMDLNSDINYRIIKEVPPKYPKMAKRMGYKKEVIIKTKFLIGLTGKVEEIIFLDNQTSYGFREEVKISIKSFKFEPIVYKNKKIKFYFYKNYKFNFR